ncbi:hypothetical protein RHMOL_Rhmol13G0012200 [Rhododendron molle]|uniref:Uncharacterized protein n=1 Tax=Rhododendron molle TaxID=49168 RepID=A0ACC0L1T3_RHOML|nr:hypothetical protein RHMOL_Rhmol13G0012200 [Rhododendron molle]
MYYRRGQDQKMAAPAERVKLGFGGFKLEDSNKPPWNPPPNPAQVPHPARDDQVIDCFKAAEKFRGVLFVDHRARDGVLVVDHRARDQPIDCKEAAKKYGGILFAEK